MVELDSLVIFDPSTSTLYAARDLPMSMNGRALQLNLPNGGSIGLRSDTPAPKKKKRVSKYSREFGRQLKKLKVERPRTAITRLMKTAHTRTRKVMKKK